MNDLFIAAKNVIDEAGKDPTVVIVNKTSFDIMIEIIRAEEKRQSAKTEEPKKSQDAHYSSDVLTREISRLRQALLGITELCSASASDTTEGQRKLRSDCIVEVAREALHG